MYPLRPLVYIPLLSIFSRHSLSSSLLMSPIRLILRRELGKSMLLDMNGQTLWMNPSGRCQLNFHLFFALFLSPSRTGLLFPDSSLWLGLFLCSIRPCICTLISSSFVRIACPVFLIYFRWLFDSRLVSLIKFKEEEEETWQQQETHTAYLMTPEKDDGKEQGKQCPSLDQRLNRESVSLSCSLDTTHWEYMFLHSLSYASRGEIFSCKQRMNCTLSHCLQERRLFTLNGNACVSCSLSPWVTVCDCMCEVLSTTSPANHNHQHSFRFLYSRTTFSITCTPRDDEVGHSLDCDWIFLLYIKEEA